jgi:biopolymer transport protein TolR
MAFTSREGKTQTALAEINMIPFIDVVLVLLIIFMITAPVIQSGIQVDVPTTEITQELTEDLLVVSIDVKENLYLQDEMVHISQIVPRIKAKLGTRTPKVYFQADKAVSWEILAKVIDTVKEGGISQLVMVTVPRDARR